MENEENREGLTNENFNSDNNMEESYGAENYRRDSSWQHTESGAEDNIAAAGIKPETPKKKRKIGRKIIAVILIVLVSAGAGFGGGIAAMYYGQSMFGQAAGDITIKPSDTVNTAEAIADKVLPSVVGISTSTEVTYQSFFGPEKGVQNGVGTGIIVDPKGYILTNSHVVSDGTAQKITVQLSNGTQVPGKVLWNDKSIDLAVVKVDAPNLKAAELGDSDTVKIGAYAAAIGNPLGLDFENSITQGVISGLNRSITVAENGQSPVTMDGLIQTDASINAGNSGGPLLNSAGQVIGINSAKAQSAEGLGFAIPINTAKPIVSEIESKGEFQRSYIGIKGASVADYLQAYPDAKLGTQTGVYVVQIYTDSPAAKAGMKEGDIVTGLNDKKVDTMTQLISDLFKYRPGDTVKLTVLRNGLTMTMNVTLTTMNESPTVPDNQQTPQ